MMEWSCAVTAVRRRAGEGGLLHDTLKSLADAGFDEVQTLFDLDRNAMAHWARVLVHIYLRHPHANRFAIFQDDIICTGGLREYLESFPEDKIGSVYLNLYTAPPNENRIKSNRETPRIGWHESDQLGKGALALVFSRDVMLKLLTAESFWKKHQSTRKPDRNIDGCVITAMKLQGIKELVHWPSLVQHTGTGNGTSAIGNIDRERSSSFPGEGVDVRSLG